MWKVKVKRNRRKWKEKEWVLFLMGKLKNQLAHVFLTLKYKWHTGSVLSACLSFLFSSSSTFFSFYLYFLFYYCCCNYTNEPIKWSQAPGTAGKLLFVLFFSFCSSSITHTHTSIQLSNCLIAFSNLLVETFSLSLSLSVFNLTRQRNKVQCYSLTHTKMNSSSNLFKYKKYKTKI